MKNLDYCLKWDKQMPKIIFSLTNQIDFPEIEKIIERVTISIEEALFFLG